jgi:class 3 adenylate cyclase
MSMCPSCGRENPGYARFCSTCGASLGAARPAGEERKIVTVLFVDVASSTELADRLDPEELREVMSAWYAAVRSEIEAQGGTVEKYIGDAVMAVFGVPASHEDDPARALRAALAARARLVELNLELAASHGLTIEIRTGVNTGEAFTALDPPPGEAMVTGVAVNAAARLEQLAEPGQILVAERTARSTPGFRFEDRGDLPLRGTRGRARAFALLGTAPGPRIRGLPGIRAPVVGREQELELLVALQERVVAEGRPQLVTIYGDPGIGKSRLVEELVDRLQAGALAPRVVSGRCLPYGEGIAFWPLAEILRDLAGLGDKDPQDTSLARLDALVSDAVGGGQPLDPGAVAALAFTLGLDSGNEDFARLQPSALRQELHRAWRFLLSAISLRAPLVVIVDDVHWADGALLDLLEEVAERSVGPLFIVCPSRAELTDARPTWGGGRRSFSSLSLGPLTTGAARELVGRLLAVDGLPEELRERILERAEGNPFFLEEILRHLIDEGAVARDGDDWRATDKLVGVTLPDTVQAVLAARIDLLEQREKRTLQQASVVGRVFWSGAVAALLDEPEDVEASLRRLEERELITGRFTSSLTGQQEFAFRHILTRDVAYESLPRRERPSAHARVAAWIEQSTGNRRGEVLGLLAHHYREAYRGGRLDRSFDPGEVERLRERALALLLEASQAALRGAAFAAARAPAESALEIARTPEERAAALEALGHGYGYAAMGTGAWQSYARAVDTLVESGSDEDERIARLCGRLLENICRWAGTNHRLPPERTPQAYLELGLDRLAPGDGEGRIRLLTAQSFWWNGYPGSTSGLVDPRSAGEAGEAAAEMAERIGRPDLAVMALDAVQHNLQRQGRCREADAAARHRLELARGVGDLNELGDSFAIAVWNDVYLGAFPGAHTLGSEGYRLLREDVPLRAVHILTWNALASFYLGEWDRVLTELELVRGGLGERADAPTSGFSLAWSAAALVHEARGDREESDRLLAQVLAIEHDRKTLIAPHSPLVMRTLILRGELVAARRRLDEHLSIDPERVDPPLLFLAEAELALAEERGHEFEGLAEWGRGRGGTSGAGYLAPAASRLAGHAELAAGRPAAAFPLFEAAATGFDSLGMAVDAAVARLDEAAALVELERGTDARSLASSARQLLCRVGYVREAARAADLLERTGRTGSAAPDALSWQDA